MQVAYAVEDNYNGGVIENFYLEPKPMPIIKAKGRGCWLGKNAQSGVSYLDRMLDIVATILYYVATL
jgi:hypothetical protein